MKLRPFSSHQSGLFVSVDGPSGAGKSTIMHHLAKLLVATGEDVHITAESSVGPIGFVEADPDVIAERLNERGPHNRFQLSPGSSHAKAHFYRQVTERLILAGFDVLRVDCDQQPPEQSATLICDRLTRFFTPSSGRRPVLEESIRAQTGQRHLRRQF